MAVYIHDKPTPQFKTAEEVEAFYEPRIRKANNQKGSLATLGLVVALGSSIYPMFSQPKNPEPSPRVVQYQRAEEQLAELKLLRSQLNFSADRWTNYSPEVQSHLSQAFGEKIQQQKNLEEAIIIASEQVGSLSGDEEVLNYNYRVHVQNKNSIKKMVAGSLLGLAMMAYGMLSLLCNRYSKKKKEALDSLNQK